MIADSGRQQAERRGRSAERIAAIWLRLKGYRMLASRYRTPVGEIDLIARRGRTIAFVEVKAREAHGSGLEAVTPAAQQRIARAAALWLARNPEATTLTLRFDVVIVQPRRLPRHLSHAFTADGGW